MPQMGINVCKERTAQFRGDELRRGCSVGRNDRLIPIRLGNAWDPKANRKPAYGSSDSFAFEKVTIVQLKHGLRWRYVNCNRKRFSSRETHDSCQQEARFGPVRRVIYQATATTTTCGRPKRRPQCAATLSNFGIALQSVAPSVADGLVWSDTIPGEPPSARGGAQIASSPAGRAIADGWFAGARPDNSVAESLPLSSANDRAPSAGARCCTGRSRSPCSRMTF